MQVQIARIRDTWIQEVKMSKREKDLRRTITTGEGAIDQRINDVLKKSHVYDNTEATSEFDHLFEEISESIQQTCDPSKLKQDCFELVYAIYSAYEKHNLPNHRACREFAFGEMMTHQENGDSPSLVKSNEIRKVDLFLEIDDLEKIQKVIYLFI